MDQRCIYKITNKVNGKIYIGQALSIEKRFARHLAESQKPERSQHSLIDKAIAKHGRKNFTCELIDDSPKTIEELNEREKYWIKYFDSTNRKIGYNQTAGGDGGNTYQFKSVEEMKEICDKISKSLSGKKNGKAKCIKALNVKTGEVLHFETVTEVLKHFKTKNKTFLINHCRHQAKSFYKKEWTFAFENDEFILDLKEKTKTIKNSENTGKPKRVKAYNIRTKELLHFDSINEACRFFQVDVKNKGRIYSLCHHKSKYFFKKEWTFAFENEEFILDLKTSEPNSTPVKVLNTKTNKEKIFKSIIEASKYINQVKRIRPKFDKNGKYIYKEFIFTKENQY